MRRMKNHTPAGNLARLVASITLIGALVVVCVVIASQQRPAPAVSTSHFVELSPGNQTGAARRIVVIAPIGEALPSLGGPDTLLMTSLVSGQLPSQAMQATVRSDSNCQADENGVSHCLNEIAFGTSTVVVRHPHKMSEVPCLTPGETVTIVSLDEYKRL